MESRCRRSMTIAMKTYTITCLAVSLGALGVSPVLAGSDGAANSLISSSLDVQQFGRLSLGRLDASRAADQKPGAVNWWGAATGLFTDASGDGPANGFTTRTGGYMLGMERVGEVVTGGLMLGQQFGHMQPAGFQRRSRINQHSTQIGAFGSVQKRLDRTLFTLDGYAAYSSVNYRSRGYSHAAGHSSFARWDNNAVVMGGVASWEQEMARGIRMRPFVGLEYSYVRMGGFSDGAEVYGNSHFGNLSGTLGLEFSRTWSVGAEGSLTPVVSLAYIGDMWRDEAEVSTGGAAGAGTDYGVRYGRNAFQVSGELLWVISANWSSSLAYTYEWRSNLQNHLMEISLTRSF